MQSTPTDEFPIPASGLSLLAVKSKRVYLQENSKRGKERGGKLRRRKKKRTKDTKSTNQTKTHEERKKKKRKKGKEGKKETKEKEDEKRKTGDFPMGSSAE